jgi:phosphohistidine phosphatase SixA
MRNQLGNLRHSGWLSATCMVLLLLSVFIAAAAVARPLLAAGQVTGQAGSGAATSTTTTIVIVRHAEKASDDPSDPSLSPAGLRRAQALVAALDGAAVSAIYSTPFKRTRTTAEAVAKRFMVPITIRPASTGAAEMVREILAKDAGKTVLIVGHSNTVPELVRAFSNRNISPLTENEYDRLLIIVRPSSGSARLFQTRYGEPSRR